MKPGQCDWTKSWNQQITMWKRCKDEFLSFIKFQCYKIISYWEETFQWNEMKKKSRRMGKTKRLQRRWKNMKFMVRMKELFWEKEEYVLQLIGWETRLHADVGRLVTLVCERWSHSWFTALFMGNHVSWAFPVVHCFIMFKIFS